MGQSDDAVNCQRQRRDRCQPDWRAACARGYVKYQADQQAHQDPAHGAAHSDDGEFFFGIANIGKGDGIGQSERGHIDNGIGDHGHIQGHEVSLDCSKR